MRTKLGTALSVIGGFLILVALLGQFYAPDKLMRTPLDVDNTTDLFGTATLSGEQVPVKAWSVTFTDSARSTDDVAVWVNSSCLVKDEGGIEGCVSSDDPEDRLLSASTDNFATDRVSGLAVNDPQYLPAEAEPHEGLVNKWPFESEKITYPWWDSVVGAPVDAAYDRTEEIDGLETWVFKVSVSDVPIELAEDVPGTYNDEKELWIEPMTGAIVDQVDHQERLDEDGEVAIAINLEFTDEEVAESIEDAQANVDKLVLVTETVPLIGYLVGIPMAIAGLVLLVLGLRKSGGSGSSATTTSGKTPVKTA